MAREEVKNKGMTEGPLFRNILLFGLPLMLSNVLQVLFNMSDVAVVGKFGPAGALGAVGSTTTYVALFTGLLIGLGAGVNTVAAQRLGAGDEDGAKRVSHTSVIIAVIYGAIVAGLAIGLSRPVLTLMGTKEQFMDGALLYIRIYFAGAVGMAVYNYGSGVLSADGDTRRPLIFLATAGVTNILLNLLFVIVCKMSVAGVALASAISQWLSCVLVLAALIRTRRPYGLRLKSLKIYGKVVRAVLAPGITAGLQNAIFQLANLFIQAGVNTFEPEVVEGNTAAANADTLVFELMSAFYTACTSFIGQNYGAGNGKRMLKSYFACLAYSFGAGAVAGIVLLLLSNAFLSVFTDSEAVMEAGRQRLSVMGFSYALSAVMDCSIAASRGINKTIVPTITVVLGSCVFRIIWVYLIFPAVGTTTSLYLLYPVSWAITAAAEAVYFAVMYKEAVKSIRPALPDGEAGRGVAQ